MGSTEISSSSMTGADLYSSPVSSEIPAGVLAGSVGRVVEGVLEMMGQQGLVFAAPWGSVRGLRLD